MRERAPKQAPYFIGHLRIQVHRGDAETAEKAFDRMRCDVSRECTFGSIRCSSSVLLLDSLAYMYSQHAYTHKHACKQVRSSQATSEKTAVRSSNALLTAVGFLAAEICSRTFKSNARNF